MNSKKVIGWEKPNKWELQDDDGKTIQTVYLHNPLGGEFTVSWKSQKINDVI